MALPAFCPDMVAWCSMHSINLGVALWVTGSTMMELMDAGMWDGPDAGGYEARFRAAYGDFCEWAHEMKIPCLGPS